MSQQHELTCRARLPGELKLTNGATQRAAQKLQLHNQNLRKQRLISEKFTLSATTKVDAG